LGEAIERATGARPRSRRPLGGGCVGEVYAIGLSDGRSVVVKLGRSASGLALEGWMLTYLKEHSTLPVPAVLHASDELLVMEHVASGGALDADTQRHAAELLAELHSVTGPGFGLERDTLIGGLPQPNPEIQSWIAFFRDHRLLHMGERALGSGRLGAPLMRRIERLAGRLEGFLEEPEAPALIHGDMWGGNILARSGRITGFVDPAIYYADPEIELAFSTMFSTFTDPFFTRYEELRPIRPGFFEVRRDIYNLYPLLVHVRLFGGSYVGGVERTLARFGF
jgi:fructosamine-3-kinase